MVVSLLGMWVGQCDNSGEGQPMCGGSAVVRGNINDDRLRSVLISPVNISPIFLSKARSYGKSFLYSSCIHKLANIDSRTAHDVHLRGLHIFIWATLWSTVGL